MTTIVWDTKVMAADTLQRISRNAIGEDADKIFTPKKEVFFEGDRVVAAAGAGRVYLLKDWWNFMCEAPRSVHDLKQKLEHDVAFDMQPVGREGFLILTVEKCFRVEVSEGAASHSDVTKVPTAIGSGGHAASPLIAEFGVFTAIARASRIDRVNTNSKVTWISHQLGSTTECAGRMQMLWARFEDKMLQFGIPKFLWRR